MSLVDELIATFAPEVAKNRSGVVSEAGLRALVSAALEVRGDASLDCSAHQTPSYGCPTCYPVIPSAAGDAVPVALTDAECDAIARAAGVLLGGRRDVIRAGFVAGYAAAPAEGDTPSVVRDALELIWTIHVRDHMHLGYERYSGIDKDCIPCIAALALGRGMDEVEPGKFRERINEIKAARAALAPAGEPDGQKNA